MMEVPITYHGHHVGYDDVISHVPLYIWRFIVRNWEVQGAVHRVHLNPVSKVFTFMLLMTLVGVVTKITCHSSKPLAITFNSVLVFPVSR